MSDILWQGLWISVLGLGILFMAMGLIYLMMVLLERVLRSFKQPSIQVKATPTKNTVVPEPARKEEIAAAIAVALAYFRAQGRRGSLGSTLEAGPGMWWIRGRVQQGRRRQSGHQNGETSHGLR